MLKTLASNYVPLLLVISEDFGLLHVVGDSGGFIKVPPGKISNDITKMVAPELTIPLSTGLQKAFKNEQEIKYTNIYMQREDASVTVNMRITPMVRRRGQEPLVVVSMEEKTEASQRASSPDQSVTNYNIGEEAQLRISDLEQELQFTRENLQSTVEELETSNEELQATNEELLASNEELQSTNEELQSVNEELFTVNTEYQEKITELTQLNSDMENLLESTNLATLFLDEQLCIRKFTPRIKNYFKILDNDIGRPLSHIS
ncbi:MAG: chemotaxis protein CheR, partial [Desulfobacterales bacterium]